MGSALAFVVAERLNNQAPIMSPFFDVERCAANQLPQFNPVSGRYSQAKMCLAVASNFLFGGLKSGQHIGELP
jgi:hypothetical protein